MTDTLGAGTWQALIVTTSVKSSNVLLKTMILNQMSPLETKNVQIEVQGPGCSRQAT